VRRQGSRRATGFYSQRIHSRFYAPRDSHTSGYALIWMYENHIWANSKRARTRIAAGRKDPCPICVSQGRDRADEADAGRHPSPCIAKTACTNAMVLVASRSLPQAIASRQTDGSSIITEDAEARRSFNVMEVSVRERENSFCGSIIAANDSTESRRHGPLVTTPLNHSEVLAGDHRSKSNHLCTGIIPPRRKEKKKKNRQDWVDSLSCRLCVVDRGRIDDLCPAGEFQTVPFSERMIDSNEPPKGPCGDASCE